MIRSYEYRIYPNNTQTEQLGAMLGDFCMLYNAALEERISAYRHGISLNYVKQANQLKECRGIEPDLSRWSFSAEQQVLRRLDKAYSAFFRRVKRGDKAGFPRFRSRSRFDSSEFRFGDGLRLNKHQRLCIVGIDTSIKVKWHRDLPVKPNAAVVCRRAGKWFVVFQLELPKHKPELRKPNLVGVDMGLTSLVACSDGYKVATPQFFKDSQKKCRRLQRALSRKKRFSGGYRKVKQNLARHSQKVAAQRRDFAHKLSCKLADAYTHIAFEDLNIKGLARGMLAKSVTNAAWSQLISFTAYKAEYAGGEVDRVNPNGTSQYCTCGAHVPKTLAVRIHYCPECGKTQDRDVVSAQVILLRSRFVGAGIAPDALSRPVGVRLASEAVCFS